ncbi:hypothetical protein [Zhongshania sp.]|uniref:hypothetical protein n=1 Tax=Zhongshania sp. TaxID=1971902 RepID=UPI003569D82F
MEDRIKAIYGDLLWQVTNLQHRLTMAEAQLKLFEDLKDKTDAEKLKFLTEYERNR